MRSTAAVASVNATRSRARPWPARTPRSFTTRSQRPRRLEHGVDVTRHLDFAPDAAHHALGVDQEGRALDPHVFAAVHALLDPGAVGLADRAVLVGGEAELELVLRLELVVARRRVAADPDHLGLCAAEIRLRVAEAAGLL